MAALTHAARLSAARRGRAAAPVMQPPADPANIISRADPEALYTLVRSVVFRLDLCRLSSSSHLLATGLPRRRWVPSYP